MEIPCPHARHFVADARKPVPRFDGVFGEPEQQPEAPLGIENAVAGAKGSFGGEHSGHGRLYRPQATLARPPASGRPHYSFLLGHPYSSLRSYGDTGWGFRLHFC